MKKHLLHTALFIFISASGISGYAQTAITKGRVLGGDSALQGATISIKKLAVLTDRKGEFILALKPGTYDLVITHTGYKKIIREIKIETGDSQLSDFILTPIEQLGEVVVLGSRSLKLRSNLNTTIPVDMFLSSHLTQTGQTNLTQMLNFAAPSINASRQLVNEPITLRGLDPDQVLILVNGTRYHNMAFLNDGRVRGILGRGSVANDPNSIPFSAIEKIEVLRDGAAAQYGSDAIAGVINIHLKKSTGKTSVQLHTGQFYRSDGENISLGINRGIAIGKSSTAGRQGFLNFSADFRNRNPTYRGGVYKGTVYINNPALDDSIIQARNFRRNKVSNAGTGKLSSLGILINGGYPIKNKTELFWTAIGNGRKNVFRGGYVFPKNFRVINPLLYPDGFKPRPKQNMLDVSGIIGLKGETKSKWNWEYSSAYGDNVGKYYAENTNNASQYYSLGKDAPTAFYTGGLVFQQLTNNLNFSKNFSSKTASFKICNIGWGAEGRLENYQIKAGEEGAWYNYDQPLQRKQGGSQNGLIFRPTDVVNAHRYVLGTYVDIESEVANSLLVDIASRYEYYNEFGGNLAGKIAARYKFSNKFSLRTSLSNGFRAPSLQQRYFSNTTRGLANVGGVMFPIMTGVFANNSDIVQAFGIPSLQAERSVNMGGGFTAALFNGISLTVDAYWIRIKNRIVLSGKFDKVKNPDVQRILANYPEVDQVQFFTNAINTRTRGIDIVLNSNWNIKKANLMVMLAANFTRTNLFGEIKTSHNLSADSLNTNTLFNREERAKVENGQPHGKIILSANYKTRKLGFQLRNTRFGKTAIVFDSNDITRDEFFSPKILTDFSINYTPKPWITLTTGANNIFDVYPDHLRNSLNTGEGMFIYAPEASPFGFNGGYCFLNIAFNF